jgi:PAS domain S-box-containing protein
VEEPDSTVSDQEVSKTKRRSEELLAIQQRFQVMLETATDVFWGMDLDGQFTDVSSSVSQVLGYSPEEFLELGLSGVLTPKCYETVRALLDRSTELARSGRMDPERAGHLVLDQEHVHKNGSVVYTEVTNHFLFDEEGRPVGYAGLIRDVTQRRQAEAQIRAMTEELEMRVLERTEALREKEEQLRHAQKMEALGRLAGGVAHDFNNLLVVIQSYASLLLAGESDEKETAEGLSEISAAAERGADLTRQLLAICRKQPLKPRTLNLEEIVHESVRMLGRVLEEDIAIEVDAAEDLGAVLADAQHLQQVLLKLAVNARDAMEDGGTLSIRAHNHAPDQPLPERFTSAGPFVVLTVSDTGCGMDAETLSRIFDPFFTTKGPGKGTGLGLSTVYGIIKQSGGEIEVHSQVGEGTTFEIYLPQSLIKVPTSREVPIVKARASRTQTVLLVEDETPVREVTKLLLERGGYRVLEAPTPEAAIKFCEEHPGPIHLMLTDVVMPRMNGIQLRDVAVERRPDLKVILMSGYPDASRGDSDAAQDDTPFIAKPFTPEKLKSLVRSVLATAEE